MVKTHRAASVQNVFYRPVQALVTHLVRAPRWLRGRLARWSGGSSLSFLRGRPQSSDVPRGGLEGRSFTRWGRGDRLGGGSGAFLVPARWGLGKGKGEGHLARSNS